jgi:O-antigen/teichoic acid export membrane protein
MAGFLAAVIGARNTLAGARFAPASLKSMLKFSMPLVLSSAAAIVSTFVDRVVVRESLGLHALGVYGVAARFASIVGILTVGLQAALSPLIYRLWRKADTAAKLHQVFRFYCAAMIPVLGGLSLFSPEIIFITSGQSFRDASLVLPPLAAASMLSSLYIFTPGLFLSGRTAIASSLNILGAVVNLGFCIILSRTVGIVGAALASAVAALVVFTGHALLGCRYFSVPFEKSHLAVCGAVLLLWVVCGIIISAQSFDGHPIFIAAKAAAILIASAGAWRYALSGYDRAALLNLLRRAKFN